MLHKIKENKKYILCLSIYLLVFNQNIFSQHIDTINYPKADIHLGISIIKGSYIGTIYQISNDFSFEASYGQGIGLFLGQGGGNQNSISIGINYHFHYLILNLTYSHLKETGLYYGHIASINIELFSIDDPGFHLMGGIGGFYGVEKYFSNRQKEGGITWNLTLGFTVL